MSDAGGPARLDASMTLLTSMLERPLDPGYAAAAARREAAGQSAATSTRTRLLAVAAIVIGLLMSVAATTLRSRETGDATVRRELIAQIEDRRTVADERVAQVTALQSEIAILEDAALRDGELGGLADQLADLRLAAAVESVRGPGLIITLDNAPTAGSDGGSDTGDGTVLSRDLFVVVNSLWEAGAEAMSINGQRLTARSPIRFAGSAILVNFRPLVPPYRISAIGDPKTMPAAFGGGVGASYMKSLSENFGMRTAIESADDLSLPGATSVDVEIARPVTGAPR